MPTFHYRLKTAEVKKRDQSQTPQSLILLVFRYSGQKLVYSTKESINPKNWDAKKQRIKLNKATTKDGQHSLNEYLDALEKVCWKTYNESAKNGVPSQATIKNALDAFRNKNLDDPKGKNKDSLYGLIDRFISGEITNHGKAKSPNTIKNYKTTKRHLQEFEKKTGYRIDFESITVDFFHKYTAFLRKRPLTGIDKIGLNQNSIGKDIAQIKVFMAEARELGLTDNIDSTKKKFSVPDEKTEAVYLTVQDIEILYNHDFSDNKRVDQVRDLFVVGCWTGLRFSDYSNIKPENIVKREGENYLELITQKTKEQVTIPLNAMVMQIFKKYSGKGACLPRAISNQKFNDYIKEAAKDAGLTEKGRLTGDQGLELWECISSHTARRSFATNLYLRGANPIDLMKVTGHRTEKSFLNYIKVSKQVAAQRLIAHIDPRELKPYMKAV